MTLQRTLQTTLFAAALMPLGGLAHAASIGSDSFGFAVTEVGQAAVSTTVTAQSVAGDCDAFDGTGCDGQVSDGTDHYVDWLDDDTFVVGFTFGPEDGVMYDLTDLNFFDGATPAPITGVTFNEFGPHETFLFDPVTNPTSPITNFQNPLISFTDTSISLTLLTAELFSGDAPTFEFTVSFAAPSMPTIPLPGSGLALITGLGGLAALRRRKRIDI